MTKMDKFKEDTFADIVQMNKDFQKKDEFKKLKKRVDKLTALENMKAVNDILLPRLNKFSKEFETFLADNDVMK